MFKSLDILFSVTNHHPQKQQAYFNATHGNFWHCKSDSFRFYVCLVYRTLSDSPRHSINLLIISIQLVFLSHLSRPTFAQAREFFEAKVPK